MNGYGHFVPALFWSITYWLCDLRVPRRSSPLRYARRGAEDSLRARSRLARGDACRALAPAAAAAALLAAAGAGCWYYYNAHVLNEYLTAADRRQHAGRLRSASSRNTRICLSPRSRPSMRPSISIPRADRSPAPAASPCRTRAASRSPQMHLTDQQESVSQVRVRPAVSPGEPRAARPLHHLRARSAARARRSPDADVLGGAHHARFPRRQRTAGVRLQRHFLRFRATSRPSATTSESRSTTRAGAAKSNWARWKKWPLRGDPRALAHQPVHRQFGLDHLPHGGQHLRRSDGDRTGLSAARLGARTGAATTSTAWVRPISWISSPTCRPAIQCARRIRGRERSDQPGGLLRPRAHLQYRRNAGLDPAPASTTTRNISARISSRSTASWNFRATGLSRSRSPTPCLTRKASASSAACVKTDDIDLTYFVTAHELGHQWWGHQLIGGQVQGSNMMSETLAQYSAYMVMQQKYGKDYMHQGHAPLPGPLSSRPRRRSAPRAAAGLGAARALRVVREGRPDHVHPGRLYRRGQDRPRAA